MTTPARSITLPAPAKLNLFLHITGRRPDGYHELQTLFHILDRGDRLHFDTTVDGRIRLECGDSDLEGPDNLVVRAARLIQSRIQASAPPGVRITLQKYLPAGAGLGGGSSDAATTLLALNQLWHLHLPVGELAAMGLQLGADVPVFVYGHSAWATGVGEKLEPVTLPRRWYTVLTPACHVSTAAIFSHRELTRNGSAIRMTDFLAGHSRNDCENLVRQLFPEVENALTELGQYASSRLTGTGSSVFAAFSDQYRAELALHEVLGRTDGLTGFVARGVDRSPVPDLLKGLQSQTQ